MRNSRQELVLAAVRELCLDTRLLFAVENRALRFFQALAFVDVRADGNPAADRAVLVALRHDSQQMPSIRPVATAQALLALERRARLYHALPGDADALDVFGGHGVEQSTGRVAPSVLVPYVICVGNGAVLAHDPYAGGQ